MPSLRHTVPLALALVAALQQFTTAGMIHAKAWLAPILVERAWNATLADQGAVKKPWPWADTWPVAHLSVPQLQVSRYVLYGNSGHALAFGPGLDSAPGFSGQDGVTLINGHRDTHFAFLQVLRPQMRISLQRADGDTRNYHVIDAVTVDSRRQVLPLLPVSEQLLLVTCYPFNALSSRGPLRYVVRALPVTSTDVAHDAVSA